MSESSPGVVHRLRRDCRACGGREMSCVLALGMQPLANAFLSTPQEAAGEQRFPLDLYVCERCSLVQLLDVIDPEVLFRHYVYVTGTSETMAVHNRAYARTVVERTNAGPRDLIVEVASNDGSLLSCFKALGTRTLGIEPARNIAAIARERGVPTVEHFFNSATAKAVRTEHGPARAVIANNVLAHVDDPADFLAGAREMITADGIVVIEVPYAREMHERGEYDTIYHEHLCYFSITALAHLGSRVGLSVRQVDHLPVHGGTIRVTFDLTAGHGAEVLQMIAGERMSGLTTMDAWRAFGEAAQRNRDAVRDLLLGFKRDGISVAGYGAPAKGNTLLNYCQIGTDLLPYTVDRNPLKVGKLTPGMHLPTRPVDTLAVERPDAVLILAWNFADEIVRQQASHRTRGGRFFVPIPSPMEV